MSIEFRDHIPLQQGFMPYVNRVWFWTWSRLLAYNSHNSENNFVCLCNKNVIDTSYYYDGWKTEKIEKFRKGICLGVQALSYNCQYSRNCLNVIKGTTGGQTEMNLAKRGIKSKKWCSD